MQMKMMLVTEVSHTRSRIGVFAMENGFSSFISQFVLTFEINVCCFEYLHIERQLFGITHILPHYLILGMNSVIPLELLFVLGSKGSLVDDWRMVV